jgi:hypothetical protein
MSKQPTVAASPLSGKQVRIGHDPDDFAKRTLSWRIGLMDRNHDEWGWHLSNDPNKEHTIWNKIHSALKGYETMTWVEIERNPHCHGWEVSKLPTKAQEALKHLGFHLEVVEGLFQLTTGNKGRIFGLRDRGTFKILWWDANHTVKPVGKKHT